MIMNDLESQMLSYYVIYYEKFKKVMKRIKKEALTGKYNLTNVMLVANLTLER